MSEIILNIVRKQKAGQAVGICSACTANPFAIKSVFQRAKRYAQPALIEATANQVDQNGGYTGMKPADYVAFIRSLAEVMDFPQDQLILGGDHLGPLTRVKDPEIKAMAYAEELVRQYVLAGFTKIHIDTSMRLAEDDPAAPLSDLTIARRGVHLCQVAEQAYTELQKINPGAPAPVYVIGSEVPIPGGAQSHEEALAVTDPKACLQTLQTFHDTFEQQGLASAWKRVVALVVQPGVEFGDDTVHDYDPIRAADLAATLKQWPQGVFEGHSTDYQTPQALQAMVQDGIAILKVGPALTFALREALFAMELIEIELYHGQTIELSNFRGVLEQQMLANPQNWQKHYHGDEANLALARAFSFSDRARYYLNDSVIEAAIQRLIENLNRKEIPLILLSQYLPLQYQAVRNHQIPNTAEALILDHIGNCLDDYMLSV